MPEPLSKNRKIVQCSFETEDTRYVWEVYFEPPLPDGIEVTTSLSTTPTKPSGVTYELLGERKAKG